jgi:hypothetical protein
MDGFFTHLHENALAAACIFYGLEPQADKDAP